jgi:hypothetical protein
MDDYVKNLIEDVSFISREYRKVYQQSIPKALSINKEYTHLFLLDKYEKNERIKFDAQKYYNEREKYNIEIQKIFDECIKEVKRILSSISYRYKLQSMSSFPKFNLIDDSDIDLGLLVYYLDKNKLFELTKILVDNGYHLNGITVNKQAPGADAYRFGKTINKIEVEIKIRDYQYSQPLIELHDKLDNKLCNYEYIYWTYHKLLLKNISKTDKKIKPIYDDFKRILYHVYFDGIDNSFIFD